MSPTAGKALSPGLVRRKLVASMKLFSAGTLLAVALLSALFCVPFSPLSQSEPELFGLEVRMRSTAPGRAQVYFDRGAGFNETDASSVALTVTERMTTLRLPLPPGTHRQLRFDPTDGDAPVQLESLRIVDRRGRLVRTLALDTLAPLHGIAAATLTPATPPRLELVPVAGTNDPQLRVALNDPLVLEPGWTDWLPADAARWAILSAAALGALATGSWFFARRRFLRPRRYGSSGEPDGGGGQPVSRRILLVAAVAVAASAYPVLFFGRSHVSPNHGTPLLYETLPTLPGYQDRTRTETMGADTGAIMLQHVPQSVVQASAWRQGEVPVWNRYNSAGTPLLGQGQSMVGDPLHLVVLAAGGAAWAWDVKYLLAKWLWAAGLGLTVLRLLRLERPGAAADRAVHVAALLVTAAAPFIGFFVNRINHPACFSLCYSPWILYCWLRVVSSPGWRETAAAVGGLMLANLAVMTSGTAKEAYMLLITLNGVGAVVLLAAAAGRTPLPGADRRNALVKIALLAWAGLLFALITAPLWATFLHDLRHAYTSYNAVKAYQLQPSLLLGLFDEVFYRPLMPGLMTFNPSLNALFLLGWAYFVVTLRDAGRSRIIDALALASLLPAALVFGVVPPHWIERLPFLGNVVHVDNTFSCVLIVLWTLLAGVGFARAFRRLGTTAGRGDLIAMTVLLSLVAAAWIGFAQAIHRPVYGTAITVNDDAHSLPVSPFIWAYIGSLAAAMGVLALVVRRGRLAGRFGTPATILIVAAALVLCWRHGLHHPAAGYDAYVVQPGPRASFQAPSPAVHFLRSAQRTAPARVFGIGSSLFPGWNATYQLETVHGPDALMNRTYRELLSAMKPIERIWDWRLSVAPDAAGGARPFLDALNVRYYVTAPEHSAALERVLPKVFSGDLNVHESPTAWPRAFFTDRVFVHATLPELIEVLRTANGRPVAGIQPEDAAALALPGLATAAGSRGTFVPATDYHLTEATTRFSVQATAPGVIALTEANWPGDVRILLNGAKQKLLRVNHAFIGVAVNAPGTYQVEVRYVPKGWYRNAALAGAGFILLAGSAAVVLGVTRRRGAQRDGIVLARPDKSSGSYVR